MPVHGNAVDLLTDYDESLHTLIADIDQAEDRVHLLYYLMFDDAVGEAIVEALQRAAARGVQCRVLLDAVGAKRGLRAYRKRTEARDIEVRAMLPGGLRWRRSGRMDLRNHRKIAVIDNEVAYVGSQNLAGPQFVPGHPNRELVARVRGRPWRTGSGVRQRLVHGNRPAPGRDRRCARVQRRHRHPAAAQRSRLSLQQRTRCSGGADPPARRRLVMVTRISCPTKPR